MSFKKTACVIFVLFFSVLVDVYAQNFSEKNYDLPVGFRSLKWGMKINEAKKIYPDLVLTEMMPVKDPKLFVYRKKNENKKISGLAWDAIRYNFNSNREFSSVNAETRFELPNKATAIEQYNDLYNRITEKYGKPFHKEKTDKEGFPFVYYAIWHIKNESVSISLKAILGHQLWTDAGLESRISMLGVELSLYSKQSSMKNLGF